MVPFLDVAVADMFDVIAIIGKSLFNGLAFATDISDKNYVDLVKSSGFNNNTLFFIYLPIIWNG